MYQLAGASGFESLHKFRNERNVEINSIPRHMHNYHGKAEITPILFVFDALVYRYKNVNLPLRRREQRPIMEGSPAHARHGFHAMAT